MCSSDLATGIAEHDNYAVEFIEATRWIRRNLPHAKVSGGVSNVSFSFRGNDPVREAIHTVFLYHAVRAGMTMGIVNAGQLGVYEEIPAELRERVEDVVLNRRPDAGERLVDLAALLAIADRLALVVLLLAMRHGNLDLRATFLEVDPQRDQRGAAALHLGLQLPQLTPMEQQLSGPTRLVVVDNCRLLVGVDVSVDQVQLAGVDPRNVDKALPLIQAEIKRLLDTKVTARELKENKSYAFGSMPIGLETNDGVAGVILDMELYGLGLNYLIEYPDKINAITAASIQAAAQKYLDADNFALAVAGPIGH